ncbi:hypothetical protein ACFLYQ_07310 [Chloroflexota bacterium]
MAKISLLVCSRVSGNKNFGLFNLLDSLKNMSASYENFEVLVKFDSGDRKVRRVVRKLTDYPFTIKHITEPRGRGYRDLHVFYNRLFTLVDEQSIVVGAVADDFEIIQQNWDEIILSNTKVFSDGIYVIHGRPHPPYQRTNYETHKFFLDYDIDRSEDLEIIDEAPLWSRKLLSICGGLGLLSFTDLWTLMLEYFLYHRCGLERTIFLEHPYVQRVLNERIDKHVGLRWTNDRANNFAFTRTVSYKTIVEYQALNIFSHIKLEELALVPPPIVPRKFDIEIPEIVPPPLSDRLKRIALNAVPASLEPRIKRLYSIITRRKPES